jgi:hypothetical protein
MPERNMGCTKNLTIDGYGAGTRIIQADMMAGTATVTPGTLPG